MNSNFVAKPRTRREVLKMGSGLAGGAMFAGLAPLGAGAGLEWWSQQAAATQQQAGQQQAPVAAPVSNDRVAQMRAQAATVPIKATRLRDNIYLLTGPGGNMVALTGS